MSDNSTPGGQIIHWLLANDLNVGALTGHDTRALRAATEIIAAFNFCDCSKEEDLLAAFRLTVQTMQPQCRRFAFHAIGMVMDWPMRAKIWKRAGLEPIGNPGQCKFER